MPFSVGEKVQLKNNPNQKGTLISSCIRGTRVFWEVEFDNSKQTYPETTLQKCVQNKIYSALDLFSERKYSDIEILKRNFSHIKINGNIQDILYSMGFTNTEFLPHQFKPVIKILNSMTNGLLIADEVGLGKTIEAGLIWTELKHRFNLKKLIIVCPSVLQEKWKRELQSKFCIKAQILNSQGLLELLNDRLYNSEFAVICSMQGLRPQRKKYQDENIDENIGFAQKLFSFFEEHADDPEKIFDMLIIDEAHYMRNQETQTSKLGTILRSVSDYAVFLSATPIQNKSDDLHTLLRMLDKDDFERPEAFSNILNENKDIVLLRDKLLQGNSDIIYIMDRLKKIASSEAFIENRQLDTLMNKLQTDGFSKISPQKLAYELENIHSLGYIYTRTRKRDIKENRVIREPIPEYIDMTENEKKAYSLITDAIKKYSYTLDKGSAEFLLCMPQRMLASSIYSAILSWKNRLNSIVHEYEDEDEIDVEKNSFSDLMNCICDAVSSINYLNDLRSHDSKFERLSECITEALTKNKNEKIIVFSSFVVTLNYLHERLSEQNIKSLLLTGNSGDKDKIISDFSSQNDISILLTSEVGSEGVDLQFCRFLINYDLPWNPMRVEQRIGRLDRIGQKSQKITIWNMLHKDTIDARIYEKLYEKLDICKEALGSFENILGSEIKKLHLSCFRLTPQEEDAMISQTKRALENQKIEQDKLEEEAAQFTYLGDFVFQKIEEMNNKKQRITRDDIRTFVITSIKLFSPETIILPEKDEYAFTIKFKPDFLSELNTYCASQKSYSNYPMCIKCVFDNKVTSNFGKTELINQAHPIVKFLAFKYEQLPLYSKGAAFAIRLQSDEFPKGDYVLGASKIQFDGAVRYENIAYVAYDFNTGRVFENAEDLFNRCVEKGTNWIDQRNLDYEKIIKCAKQDVSLDLVEKLEDISQKNRDKNNDRIDFQIRHIEKYREEQISKYEERIQNLRNGTIDQQKMVNATIGKRDVITSKLDTKIETLNQRKFNLSEKTSDICLALVHVE